MAKYRIKSIERNNNVRIRSTMRFRYSSNVPLAISRLLLLLLSFISIISTEARRGGRQAQFPHSSLFSSSSSSWWPRRRESSGTTTTSNPPPQEIIRRYTYLDARGIYEVLDTLSTEYPNLSRLSNAQTEYGLPAAGEETDCAFDRQNVPSIPKGCLNWILTIQDKLAHPEGSESAKYLPEVFLSGALHGDERVGPTAVVETAALLLDAADCEGFPRGDPPSKHSSSLVWKQWEDELLTARNCRSALRSRGVNDSHRQWLARLVTTRRVVIIPTANALGYYRHRRAEDNHDPNRDFPYDLRDSTACMLTIAGRTLNEVFRAHVFRLALTFHAGTTAIGYEWGAPHYDGVLSPDHHAQDDIARGFSRYAGQVPAKYNAVTTYPVGTMNEIVYPVRGGMEDWAYASSWDTKRSNTCRPDTYGGYPAEKTQYNNATLRAFNMLVETSKLKTPDKYMLGTDRDVLNKNQIEAGRGHISRNIRLALMAVDVVEPYVAIVSVENKYLQDDIVPYRPRTARTCVKDRAASVPKKGLLLKDDGTIIEWTVGGAFRVNATGLLYGKWDDLPKSFDGSLPPTLDDLELFTNSSVKSLSLDERDRGTRWAEDEENDDNNDPHFLGPSYSTTIDLRNFQVGDRIAVLAYAVVDQSWADVPSDQVYGPHKMPPQSHMANVRTNPDWHFESAGNIVQGRLSWFSPPLTLHVKKATSATVETSMRLAHDFKMSKEDNSLSDIVEEETVKLQDLFYAHEITILVVSGILLLLCLVCCVACKPSSSSGGGGAKFRELDMDDDDDSVNQYKDNMDEEDVDSDCESKESNEEEETGTHIELTTHTIT